jgi:hypothetical protein
MKFYVSTKTWVALLTPANRYKTPPSLKRLRKRADGLQRLMRLVRLVGIVRADRNPALQQMERTERSGDWRAFLSILLEIQLYLMDKTLQKQALTRLLEPGTSVL